MLETARALLFYASIPIKYWVHCIMTTYYVINFTPSIVLSNKTPFEMLFGRTQSYDHLQVFSCLCYATTLRSQISLLLVQYQLFSWDILLQGRVTNYLD